MISHLACFLSSWDGIFIFLSFFFQTKVTIKVTLFDQQTSFPYTSWLYTYAEKKIINTEKYGIYNEN